VNQLAGDRRRTNRVSSLGLIFFALSSAHCRRAPRDESRVEVPMPSSRPGPIPSHETLVAAATSLPSSAPPAPSVAPAEHPSPVVIAAVQLLFGERQDSARVIASVKPGFVRCFERSRDRLPPHSPPLRGRLGLRVEVSASGQVRMVNSPEYEPRQPRLERGNFIAPNPSDARLANVFVPCAKELVRQLRFAPSEVASTITFELQLP
jgi:hypothetical protein